MTKTSFVDDKTVAVITGANTGIGRVTALELAKRGATVILACRSAEKTQPVIEQIKQLTGNENIEFIRLDLGDLYTVKHAAQEITDKYKKVQLLINNAGVAGQRGITVDGFELAFGTNHLGHFLLTSLLLPTLLASGPSRVVNVSSNSHLDAKNFDFSVFTQFTPTYVGMREYEYSKLCNVLFTQELARREDPKKLTTYSVHPGRIASDIWERRMPKPVFLLYKRLYPMKTVEEGARSSIYCATEIGIEEHNGRYFHEDCTRLQENPLATPERGKELWERSEHWVQEWLS